MEAAVPEVVPDPSGAVVPVISDSSADLDKGVDGVVVDVVEGVFEDVAVENEVADEDADVEDEVPVSTPVGVPVPSSISAPVAVGPAPLVPVVTKEVQAPAVSVGSSGSPVRSSGWGWGTPSPSVLLQVFPLPWMIVGRFWSGIWMSYVAVLRMRPLFCLTGI